MAYRDELEALRAHVDRLEQENESLRRENDALRAASPRAREGSGAERWLGGPVRIEVERSLDGSLPSSAHERIVEVLRARFGMIGETGVLGSTLTWKIGPPASQRTVEVTLTARHGRTHLRVVERLGQLAGGLFGGIVGGAGGGGLGVVIPLGVMVDPLLALVLAPAWVGAVYAIVRSAYGGVSHGREREIEALARELEEAIGDALPRPARRVRIEASAGASDRSDPIEPARDEAQIASDRARS